MSPGWRAGFRRCKGVWFENNSLFLLQTTSMFNFSQVGQEFGYLTTTTRLNGTGAWEARVEEQCTLPQGLWNAKVLEGHRAESQERGCEKGIQVI